MLQSLYSQITYATHILPCWDKKEVCLLFLVLKNEGSANGSCKGCLESESNVSLTLICAVWRLIFPNNETGEQPPSEISVLRCNCSPPFILCLFCTRLVSSSTIFASPWIHKCHSPVFSSWLSWPTPVH